MADGAAAIDIVLRLVILVSPCIVGCEVNSEFEMPIFRNALRGSLHVEWRIPADLL
jgi:hypothetical protein